MSSIGVAVVVIAAVAVVVIEKVTVPVVATETVRVVSSRACSTTHLKVMSIITSSADTVASSPYGNTA